VKKHLSILALASLIVTSTTFAVLAYPKHANVIADGCPLPYPSPKPKTIYADSTAALNSQVLVADGAPLPYPPAVFVADGAPLPYPPAVFVADGAPLPYPPAVFVADGEVA